MDALQSNIGSLVLVNQFYLHLSRLSTKEGGRFTIKQLIAALETTTTLTRFGVCFDDYEATPENNRKVIEPLCRCMANLRRHNRNHPLREFEITNAEESHSDSLDLFLGAAKQCEIRDLSFFKSHLRIQSLVEYCRDNTHLQHLTLLYKTRLSDKVSTDSPQVGLLQDSSAVLALDLLNVDRVIFENSQVASKFLSLMAHATYTKMYLGKISVGGDGVDDGDDEDFNEEEENKIARLHIVSELVKPSVEKLTLMFGCHIEAMDVIKACATVKQIQPEQLFPPRAFYREDEIEDMLRAI